MRAWVFVVLVVVGCGGAVVEPPEPQCVVEGIPNACTEGVYVFTDESPGTSVGNDCAIVGCTRGNRCAVFGDEGTRYGTCR
jgi:hypothetical protein